MENHQNHKAEPDIEKKNHQQQQQQHRNEAWGTWEELLLACAVNRHGSKDWDAVAMEVQSRTTPGLLATARHCEQKFHDLNRRFAEQCNDDVTPPCQNGAAAAQDPDHVPWLDELRKLRVAELRREVQRRDVSILSLQLEVKRLEEEKAKENDGKDDAKPDLAVSGEARPENDKAGGEVEEAGPANSEPDERTANNTDKTSLLPTTGDESDRENQSVNESNSTGSRFEKTGDGDVKTGTGPDPVQTGSKEPDPVEKKRKPVGEESNNGSYDALAKVPTSESVPPSVERKVEEDDDDDSSELHDSVAHSGEGATRESSEVQSSASLTRKRKTRRRKEVSGGTTVENDEVATVKSEPLVGVLELIKGHEHISLFERRLESQMDSDRYKDIVKQPLELETIQLRLQKGQYSPCTSAFFRDLLLLFTNAIVFFPHDSTESQAARQLHRLVTAEMKNHGQAQSDPIPRKNNDSLPPNAPLAKSDPLFNKNKASGPILVCRKRSSMSAKPSSATFGSKGDQPIFNDKKERPSSDAKPPLKPSSSDTDEEKLPKAKEKPVTGARSLRRSNKNLNNNNNNNNNKKLSSNSTPKAGSSGNKSSEAVKQEKSKAEGGPDKKRNAAADFLKRIKRNTSAEASKGGSGSVGGSGGGGSSSSSKGGISGKEQKKMVNNGKGDKGKERASRHNNNVGGGSGSGDKRNNKNTENNSQSKRSVGRPPKKAAADTNANAGSAKRGRESSANASASAGKDKRPKKRSKK